MSEDERTPDETAPKVEGTDTLEDSERGLREKQFSRRALLQSGWIVPVVMAVPTLRTALSHTDLHLDNHTDGHIDGYADGPAPQPSPERGPAPSHADSHADEHGDDHGDA